MKIAVVCTETAKAMFHLGSYTPAHPRLVGLTWGGEDLSAAVGATTAREADGGWTFPYLVARTQCLFAAAAAQVAPLETLYADFRDADGPGAHLPRARRDGFTGRIAIHPDQIATINACFSPSDTGTRRRTRAIVEAFEANPDAGTLGINGKMYDVPHLQGRAPNAGVGVSEPRTPPSEDDLAHYPRGRARGRHAVRRRLLAGA